MLFQKSTIVLFFALALAAPLAGCDDESAGGDCSSACDDPILGSAVMQAGATCNNGACGTPDLVTDTVQTCTAACAAVTLGGAPLICSPTCSYVPQDATSWSYAFSTGSAAGLAAYSDGAGHQQHIPIPSCDAAPDPNALPGYPFQWTSCCCAAQF